MKLIKNRDKKTSVENDQYLNLIVNMLEYNELEKNTLKSKMQKAKGKGGGVLGFLKA